jgi:predicted XRE-type DNA-binding protein
MSTEYRWTHAVATGLACGAIAYQTAVIWEQLIGVSTTTKMGVPLATVSAALLPVLAEAAWRGGERTKALLLGLPVLVLLAFVLPSGISRLGEVQEARVSAAVVGQADQAKARSDLTKADKLVTQAEGWVASECGSGAGPKCKGVTYTLNQRQAYQRELAAKVEGSSPVTTPWLPAWHPALLPIGLEIAILASLFYGMGPLTRVQAAAAIAFPTPVESSSALANPVPGTFFAITERDFAVEPITEKEIDEIKRVVGAEGLMNKELAAKLQVSQGQCSKLVTAAIADGKLSKIVNPANRRAVLIRAA